MSVSQLIPINNSDTAWLIVADYNQDNNLPYEDLKEDIISPNVDEWFLEYAHPFYRSGSVGGFEHQCVGGVPQHNINYLGGLNGEGGATGAARIFSEKVGGLI